MPVVDHLSQFADDILPLLLDNEKRSATLDVLRAMLPAEDASKHISIIEQCLSLKNEKSIMTKLSITMLWLKQRYGLETERADRSSVFNSYEKMRKLYYSVAYDIGVEAVRINNADLFSLIVDILDKRNTNKLFHYVCEFSKTEERDEIYGIISYYM